MSIIQRLQTEDEAHGPILTANDKKIIGPRSVSASQTEGMAAKSWYLDDWTGGFLESICCCRQASLISRAIFYATGVKGRLMMNSLPFWADRSWDVLLYTQLYIKE